MQLDLENKHALVCGSTQGIGKACAIALAEQGANVTLLARNENSLKSVITEMPTSGKHTGTHNYLVADFSSPQEVEATIKTHLSNHPGFHILVNNTGGPPGGRAIDAGAQEFDAAFRQHLLCNHLLVQALVPGMQAYAFGRIINIISTSVKQPLDNLGVSNTIRGAVANWSKTLANELGQYGITVNNVLPGATATERLFSIIRNKAEKSGISPEQASAAMQNTIPARRFAEASEVANAVTFLASAAAAYINGVNLPVDGGRTKSL
ncbi:MAG: SDR family oxidoreductase [Gammaproteobacteria bacterium]|nr:SDR family oxidoreductase [Gammaproteobacteria bacterium]NNC98529.1 SDR family oxidoreductase [Gammaproteobacteria bacterium]NNM14151.1 SDR family oxidoreductase [Gammaproteobacteria bacterium]